MSNLKFSQFQDDSFTDGYLVGYLGGNNIKVSYASLVSSLESGMNLGDIEGFIDLGSKVTGILSIDRGGTEASTAEIALNNLTESSIKDTNEIMWFSGGVVTHGYPYNNPLIPLVAVSSYKWGGLNPYYTFGVGTFNTIPYDTLEYQVTTFLDSTFLPEANYISATETAFVFSSDAHYSLFKIEVQSHFTEQLAGDMMQVSLIDSLGNQIEMVSQYTSSGQDIMCYGYCYYTPQPTNDTLKIAANPSGNSCSGTDTYNGFNRVTISLAQRYD